MTDIEILQKHLNEVEHMVIAVTLDDGRPWAVPVHIKLHNGKNFEWESKVKTVHSQAMVNHPDIALTVFSIDTDLGFYAKATAKELPNTRRTDGYARYRATVSESWLNEKHIKRPISL